MAGAPLCRARPENDKIENVVEKSLIALNAIADAVEAGLEARNPEE